MSARYGNRTGPKRSPLSFRRLPRHVHMSMLLPPSSQTAPTPQPRIGTKADETAPCTWPAVGGPIAIAPPPTMADTDVAPRTATRSIAPDHSDQASKA
jgi:hypothetical protein